MGNKQEKQNAEFGKNFNFAQHNRKMGQISQNYSDNGFSFQSQSTHLQNRPKQQSFQQMQRKNAIFKPSIDISINRQAKISFQYNSLQGCELFIYLGVNNINQDPAKKNTTQIQADQTIKQLLPPGTKAQFTKTYPNPNPNLPNKQVILRVQQYPQATQISLRRILKDQQQWKIILEKLQIGNKSYELQNIYGGGDNGQECIVCMCEMSDTIVKPCNHLCLCKSCAGIMGSKTNKCPICRVNIQGLLTVKKTEQQQQVN